MQTDQDLLEFHRDTDRVGSLVRRAKTQKNEKFLEVVVELENIIEGGKIYFYGTRFMGLGHEKSHVNIFVDVGES
jgi:hypothetical protein